MKIDINRLASLLGLGVTPAKNALCGTKNGYNTFVTYFKGDMTFLIRIYANHTDITLRQAMYDFCASHDGYAFVRMWDSRVTANLTLTDADTEETAAGKLSELYDFIASLGFTPCCSTCGENKPARLYDFMKDGLNLCADCESLVNGDIVKANALRDMQKPRLSAAIPWLVLSAALVFIISRYSSGVSASILSGMADGALGVIIAVITVKLKGIKTSILMAVLNVVICLAAYTAGCVGWHADYFAKFNRDNAESRQYIIDYCEAEKRGETPYQDSFSSGDADLIGKYKYLHHCTADEREEYYTAAVRIVDHQTTKSCVKDFKELMFSSYGNKMRNGFFRLIFGAFAGLVGASLIFWRAALRGDKLRYRLTPLVY